MDTGNAPRILDQHGHEIQASSYGGEDRLDRSLAGWMPMLQAPDDEVVEGWETSVGRLRELIRENGITSGLVQTQLDQVIGPDLKLVSKPDYRFLGISREDAKALGDQIETAWRAWAYDLEHRCHASRVLDFSGILRQGYRSRMMSGEIMATAEWIDRPGWPYRTSMQPIDPERVSTPAGKIDDFRLRHGIVKDRLGAPVGAFIREAHPHDTVDLIGTYRWKFVRRETEWGRLNFLHIFDQERPSQSRGRTGLLAAIKQIKMLERWQSSAMQAAIINSMYAAVIESSVEHPEIMAALGGGGDSPMEAYLADALEYHKGTNKIRWDGSKIAHLFPGEKLNLMSAKQPVAAFESFERCGLRNIAAAGNISYEQLSKDYTNTNYSSARASMLEAWKFILSERHHVADKYATQIFALWLEDAIDAGQVELPAGAPDFYAPGAKRAYTQCKWIGPGRDQIDPVKAEQSTKIRFSIGMGSHEEEAAQRGYDLDELIDEQVALYKKLLAEGVPDETARRIVWGSDNVEYEDQEAEDQDRQERNQRDAA